MFTTPLQPFHALAYKLGIQLQVKRDDLYPFTGGGNKGRKIQTILEMAHKKSYNALVTTGGIQSNHARATAIAAAENRWPCTLVLHGDQATLDKPASNLLLSQLTGAKLVVCQPDQIAEKLASEYAMLRKNGLNPLLIPGGGHCLAGGLAYYNAVLELTNDWIPDYIVLASGTGTTQAGILAGIEQRKWSTQVLGISIARSNPRGSLVVDEAYSELRDFLKFNSAKKEIIFYDDWTLGGYEKVNEAIYHTIKEISQYGLIMDPTYTGKAFYGLLELIKQKIIQKNSKVLFWHTGGLLNLLAHSVGEIMK